MQLNKSALIHCFILVIKKTEWVCLCFMTLIESWHTEASVIAMIYRLKFKLAQKLIKNVLRFIKIMINFFFSRKLTNRNILTNIDSCNCFSSDCNRKLWLHSTQSLFTNFEIIRFIDSIEFQVAYHVWWCKFDEMFIECNKHAAIIIILLPFF